MNEPYRLQVQAEILAKSAVLTEDMLQAAMAMIDHVLPGDVRSTDGNLLGSLVLCMARNYATIKKG